MIGLGDLPPELSGITGAPTPALWELPKEGTRLDEVLTEVERRLILDALSRTGGVRTRAAELLGVTFRSLRYRLKKHGLGDDSDDEGETS